MMELQEAFQVLKKHNALWKPLFASSPLWKKVILDILERKDIERNVLMAAITIAGTMEDKEIIEKMYLFFKSESDDEVRKAIVESWKNNFCEIVLEKELEFLGIRERLYDRYIRQIVSQNIQAALKFLLIKKPINAKIFINKLKHSCLNSDNTFTRMNTAIILRGVGDKRLLPDLEKRLEVEKSLLNSHPDDVGIPYVIRELEKTVSYLEERS